MEWTMRYPGGKNRMYQQIINLMPRHRVYIETHLGSGAVLRNKLPAQEQHGVDLDPAVMRHFESHSCNFAFHQKRAEEFLSDFQFKGDELVYSDPPYPPSCRRRPKIYRYEYTDADHAVLLSILKGLPCLVMVSSYPNSLYEAQLAGWFSHQFQTPTQSGQRTEVLWTNFQPQALHDTRYLGKNFTERQAIKRKLERWRGNFFRETPQFRQAFAEMCLQPRAEYRTTLQRYEQQIS